MKSRGLKGDKMTQTDQIIEYFMKYPGKLLSPSDVANGLELNLQSTTTIINRLATEGVLIKEARGSYRLDNPISTPIIKKIYNGMYNTLVEGIGEKPLQDATHMGPDAFNEDHPIESLLLLIDKLEPIFGSEIVNNMLEMTISWEFQGEKTAPILEGVHNMLNVERGDVA